MPEAAGPTAPRGRRPWAAGPLLAGLALGLLGGCLDLVSLREIAFPPTVPGLGEDRAWRSVPVGVWMVEGEVAPVAVAVCAPPGCMPDATVGVFRASGGSAPLLLAEAAEPGRLLAALGERRRSRSVSRDRAKARSALATEPLRVGRFNGLVLRLARQDGSRRAYGVALASERDGAALAVIVLAAQEEEARRIARDVAAALG